MDKYYKIYLNHFLWTYIVSPFETTHNNLETIPSGDILIISTVPPPVRSCDYVFSSEWCS